MTSLAAMAAGLESCLVFEKLEAIVATAPPLAPAARELLSAQLDGGSSSSESSGAPPLPPFAALAAALGIAVDRTPAAGAPALAVPHSPSLRRPPTAASAANATKLRLPNRICAAGGGGGDGAAGGGGEGAAVVGEGAVGGEGAAVGDSTVGASSGDSTLAASSSSGLERTAWRTYIDHGVHELLSEEMVQALAAHLRESLRAIREAEAGGGEGKGGGEGEGGVDGGAGGDGSERVLTILELGAGSGVLSQRLAGLLCNDGKGGGKHAVRVVATDNGLNKIGAVWEGLERMDSRKALARYRPDIVIVCWMPSGVDWTEDIRRPPRPKKTKTPATKNKDGAPSSSSSSSSPSSSSSADSRDVPHHVHEYILLGVPDSGTCGDEWATWGVLFDNCEEYGIDEDSVPPYREDGYTREALPDVAQWQACRFDSAAARGFSDCQSFYRGKERRKDALRAPGGTQETGSTTRAVETPRASLSLAEQLLAGGGKTSAEQLLAAVCAEESGDENWIDPAMVAEVVEHARKLTGAGGGANAIDRVGGEPTRPGADRVGADRVGAPLEEKTDRVTPAVQMIASELDTIRGMPSKVAVNTTRSEVSVAAVQAITVGERRCGRLANHASESSSAFHLACAGGDLEAVRHFVEEGGAELVRAVSKTTVTSLHKACLNGHLEVARLLIEVGGVEFVRAGGGEKRGTALHWACQKGHLEVARLLVEAGGAHLKLTGNGEKRGMALHWACQKGHLEVVRFLIEGEEGELTRMVNVAKWTALHETSKNGHLDVVRLLVEAGGAELVGAVNDLNVTALHLACQKGYMEVARLLVAAEGGVRALKVKAGGKFTPFEVATREGHADIAAMLAGAFREHDKTMTDLHLACADGNLQAARLLVEAGGAELVRAGDDTSRTALHFACLNGHLEVARLLVEVGGTELVQAVPLWIQLPESKNGYVKLRTHQFVGAANDTNWTALHAACQNGHLEVARLLVEVGGAELMGAVTDTNVTALHLACLKGDLEMARLLVEAKGGLDLLKAKADGAFSPFDLATREGHADIAAMLKSAMREHIQASLAAKVDNAIDSIIHKKGGILRTKEETLIVDSFSKNTAKT